MFSILQKKKNKPNSQLYIESYNYYNGLSNVDWGHESGIPEVNQIRDYMAGRGFSPQTLTRHGAKYTYNDNYKIIFPILDNGTFAGWVCRTDVPAVEEKRKYLYNTGFRRSQTLAGAYGHKKYVFVVEGYLDRIKLMQNMRLAGVRQDVVALLGWKASDTHIQKLKSSGVETVVSVLDNDKCGREGTEYLGNFFEVFRFCYLRGVKDPGEMGTENFKKMYERTINKYGLN